MGTTPRDNITNLQEYMARTSPTKDDSVPGTIGGNGNATVGGDTDLTAYYSVIVILFLVALVAVVFFMRKSKGAPEAEE
jgi:hypothetical protein